MKKVFQEKIKKYQAKNILFIANFLNGLNKKLQKNKGRHKKNRSFDRCNFRETDTIRTCDLHLRRVAL